jgi:hypothetical protein
MSLKMLQALPFPKKLRRIPEIAGGHHEKLNGKGYPLGLTAEQLSLEARILAVADVFEGMLNQGLTTLFWNASGFSSGIYFVRLQSGTVVQTQKIVLVK